MVILSRDLTTPLDSSSPGDARKSRWLFLLEEAGVIECMNEKQVGVPAEWADDTQQMIDVYAALKLAGWKSVMGVGTKQIVDAVKAWREEGKPEGIVASTSEGSAVGLSDAEVLTALRSGVGTLMVRA